MSETYEQLMQKSKEELIDELETSLKKELNSETTKTMAMLGAAGVSPKHMVMYQDSLEKIEAFKERQKQRDIENPREIYKWEGN